MSSSLPGDIPPGAQYVGTEQVGYVLFYLYELDPWVSIYEPIADRVNAAFEGWSRLPEPGDFDPAISALEEAVDAVTPASQGEGTWSFVDVEVNAAMERMYTWISPQSDSASSSLLFAFDSAYGIGRITGVMANQAQVAAALGFAVAGEKQIWSKGQEDLMAILDDGVTTMDVTAGGGLGSINLKVVKAFVNLAAVFTPKQIDVVLAGLATGIDFLDTVLPKPKVESKESSVTGSTYNEIMGSFEGALRDLERAISDEELEIRDKLVALGDVLASRPARDFHLHPDAGIDTEFVHATEIRINVDHVQTIGTRDVPTVAGAFLDAADHASQHTGEAAWIREHGIGWGTSGPWSRWHGMLAQFDAISTGSAKELVEAGKLLATAAGWIEDSDHDANNALAGHSDELERGQLQWQHGPGRHRESPARPQCHSLGSHVEPAWNRWGPSPRPSRDGRQYPRRRPNLPRSGAAGSDPGVIRRSSGTATGSPQTRRR